MSKHDVTLASLTICGVIMLIITVLLIKDYKSNKPVEIHNEVTEPEVKVYTTTEEAKDNTYFSDTTSIDNGYNVKDLEGLTVTCIDTTLLDDVSYVLLNAFTLSLQAYCNDNNINEKFKATNSDISSGVNSNIVMLRAVSDSYDLTLSYDLSTDFVNVTVN